MPVVAGLVHFLHPFFIGGGFEFFLIAFAPLAQAVIATEIIKKKEPAVNDLVGHRVDLHPFSGLCYGIGTPSTIGRFILAWRFFKLFEVRGVGEEVYNAFVIILKLGGAFHGLVLEVADGIKLAHGHIILMIEIPAPMGVFSLSFRQETYTDYQTREV